MTLEECVALLTPIALAYRADMDGPTFRAYHRVLKDVPVALAVAALEALESNGSPFMPNAPMILAASETSRRQLLAAHPYDGCADCEGQRGYRTVITAGRQNTVERCPCRARHEAKLASLGLREPLALLPGESGPEGETAYPTLEQLPANLRARIESVASQKRFSV